MKKIYSLVVLFLFTTIVMAQVQVTVESPGVCKITYGSTNDFSLYDPGFGTPTFYVHLWVDQNNNSQNILFEDSWSNSNVTMNWDSSANAYVGFVNLNNKLFTNTNNVMAPGTTVSQISFVFKDQQNGATKQSGNTSVFVNTTTLGTLAVLDAKADKIKSFVAEGKLYTSEKGNLQLIIYDFSGKLIKKENVRSYGSPIDLSIFQKGNYILHLSDINVKEIIKFKY
ncbi:T9SS type A sorting domain-containing protein [Chryseobacterium sp. MEBOG07]|uniref:T9SS type A sorting domain-containing protein n=1 Tax=Chryseobacterium sp. MEBOG07 TaxID=2879939 RepID=UPI001F353D9D|nr:T9SS type A sorting domain-containing protein [Chryseobacterium sp. MEBOG07]UKB79977.1 T9SS type A sorting domain-containing protein [Chryseobacterium sp. MEBOG07]